MVETGKYTLTAEDLESIVGAAKVHQIAPAHCDECGKELYVVKWSHEPGFNTPGIMFVTSDEEERQVAIAIARDKLTCALHTRLEYRGSGKAA